MFELLDIFKVYHLGVNLDTFNLKVAGHAHHYSAIHGFETPGGDLARWVGQALGVRA